MKIIYQCTFAKQEDKTCPIHRDKTQPCPTHLSVVEKRNCDPADVFRFWQCPTYEIPAAIVLRHYQGHCFFSEGGVLKTYSSWSSTKCKI